MRIAVLTNAFPPDARGGAGRIAETYAEALKRRGHTVRVWGAGSAFDRLGEQSAMGRLLFHVHDLSATQDTVKGIIDWKPDMLMTHNLTGCGIATPRSIARAGIPWFHLLHDVQLFEPSGQMVHGEGFVLARMVWRRVWGMLRRIAMGRPRGVVSPTHWLIDEHVRRGFFSKVANIVIPNPIGIAVAPTVGMRDTARLLYVGRMDADKGLGILFEAWSGIRDAATELVLIGDGPWRSRFEGLKDPKVHALGRRASHEVMDRMRTAGVVVVPSLVCENQPTVILEALASGCHVVASDTGGVRETVAGCGELVVPGDVTNLVEACRAGIMSDIGSGERMRRASVLEDHRPEFCVERFEAFVRSNL